MIEDTLKQFGLHDTEAQVFLFLVQNGEYTIGNLAIQMGLSRPSLYGFVATLKEVGLVVESQKNGVKVFSAVTLDKVKALLDEKLHKLKQAEADISRVYQEALLGQVGTSPKFQVFEGAKGLQHALKDMLLYKDIQTKAYWPIKLMVEILSKELFVEHNHERIQRNIYVQALWPESQKLTVQEHPYLGSGKEFLREIRIVPKEISFSMGYWIYGNKVVCISSRKESFGFIIESKEFAEMLGSQFDLMWQVSKPI